MFICSVKTSRFKLIGIIIAVLAAIFVALCLLGKSSESKSDTKADTKIKANLTVSDPSDIKTFLESFGWEVSDEACEIVEVTIPAEFNAVYTEYNNIQKTQGFDLGEYKGTVVKRYAFEVYNYPDYPDYIRANVLVHDGKIIGGDICSTELDGFIQGFEMK